MTDATEATPSGPTARVADGYGPDPHQHKPSQDPFDPETADEKQAGTGDAAPAREEQSSPGSSSKTSSGETKSSGEKSQNAGSKPARTTVSRTAPDRTGNSSADSMGTDRN